VELVDDDRVPVLRSEDVHEVPARQALDRGEQVLVRGRRGTALQELTEIVIVENVPERVQRLREDLLAVGHEEQARPQSVLHLCRVVERGDHGLSGSGRCDHQVLPTTVLFPLHPELLEDRALVLVWSEIEEEGGRWPAFSSLRRKRSREPPHRIGAIRVVRLELAVFPERIECTPELLDDGARFRFARLEVPFEVFRQRDRREVRRSDVHRAEARRSVKQPRLGV
jgi:hypothetical protein